MRICSAVLAKGWNERKKRKNYCKGRAIERKKGRPNERKKGREKEKKERTKERKNKELKGV